MKLIMVDVISMQIVLIFQEVSIVLVMLDTQEMVLIVMVQDLFLYPRKKNWKRTNQNQNRY